MYTVVVWDWNGTLLDDVGHNLTIVNSLLTDRDLPVITIDTYKRFFRMPIKDFYEDIGFDLTKHSFESIAADYNRLYRRYFRDMPLTEGITELLATLKSGKIKQYIVSASEQTSLLEQVKQKGIAGFFTKIAGNPDYSVISKVDRAREVRKEIGASEKILFVGDLDHDYEVANAMGADCVIYKKGHQRDHAKGTYRTIERMGELADIVGIIA